MTTEVDKNHPRLRQTCSCFSSNLVFTLSINRIVLMTRECRMDRFCAIISFFSEHPHLVNLKLSGQFVWKPSWHQTYMIQTFMTRYRFTPGPTSHCMPSIYRYAQDATASGDWHFPVSTRLKIQECQPGLFLDVSWYSNFMEPGRWFMGPCKESTARGYRPALALID